MSTLYNLVLATVLTQRVFCLALAQDQSRPTSVREDLAKASVVVLAKVTDVRDDARRPGLSGWRPVRVAIDIQRVLKGKLDARTACLIYPAPYGGYHGPRFAWIEVDELGIFLLVPAAECFGVANNARAIIPVSNIPRDARIPLDLYIAQATLPTERGCPDGAYQVAEDVRAVSIPLIGSRVARTLMGKGVGSGVSRVARCSCIVMAMVWGLDEECLSFPGADHEMKLLRETNLRILRRDRDSLVTDPLAWFRTMISSLGADGTLLRLGFLASRLDVRLEPKSCQELTDGVSSKELNIDSHSSVLQPQRSVEELAWRQFGRWLGNGCPVQYRGLYEPPVP